MFQRILLPVDLTDKNQEAVAAAGQLLDDSGEAVLLHVIEAIADSDFEDLQDFYQRLEEKARTGMSALAEPLEAAGIAIEQRVIYGRRAREIVAFAQERRVDLIVVSSRPLDPDNPEAVWASISHQVAILAGCPVLLVR